MNMTFRKSESYKEGYAVYRIVRQLRLGGEFFLITQVFKVRK